MAAAVLAIAMVFAACTGGTTAPTPVGSASNAATPSQMLVLDRAAGVEAIDPSTGSVMFQQTALTPLADWSKAFTASTDGGATDVREIDPTSGATLTSARVHGRYAIGAVAADGDSVALVAPPPSDAQEWTPEPRTSTRIVVAQPGDPTAGPSRRYRLHGNFAPEAFTSDGSELLMLEYLPPADPESYRVVRLELSSGHVGDLYGRTKFAQPMGPMSGTRLQQIPAPDGSRLYTLYTDQPADYAKQYSEYDGGRKGAVAFIHTLDLQQSWAYCVDLPRAFGPGEASAKAIALSPDGSRLYAVDADRGLVAAMDTQGLRVVGRHHTDLGLPGGGQTVATVSADGGTLFVARGSRVVEIGLEEMHPARSWSLDGPVTGLASSSDATQLYAATTHDLHVLNPETGQNVRSLPVSGVTGIAYLGATSG
jgi:hypothetical protein